MDLDFKELSGDADIIKRLTNLDDAIGKIEEVLAVAEDPELYEKLSTNDKIQYNLLLSYALNGLFWMYLRTEGIEPNKHKIKNENERLKKSMLRARQLHERNTIMPRIDKGAAARFIKHGLWTPVPRPEEAPDTTENWDEQEITEVPS